MNNIQLHERAMAGAETFLRNRGYEVVCKIEDFHIAKDGKTLVVAHVSHNEGEIIEGEDKFSFAKTPSREKFENICLSYIVAYGCEPCEVRFDCVDLYIVLPDSALVRHHISCINTM